MKRWLWLILALGSIGSVVPAFGAGIIIVDEAQWWPGPHPPGPVPPWHPVPPWPRPIPHPPIQHAFAPLEIRSVQVNAKIRDQVATTSVDQEFFNPNATSVEGTFLFPVPRGAHLDKFTMDIDGKPAEAELVSAEKARHIYE